MPFFSILNDVSVAAAAFHDAAVRVVANVLTIASAAYALRVVLSALRWGFSHMVEELFGIADELQRWRAFIWDVAARLSRRRARIALITLRITRESSLAPPAQAQVAPVPRPRVRRRGRRRL